MSLQWRLCATAVLRKPQWFDKNWFSVLTDSWMHSFLSSISRRVCKILMHSFSSLSISFLVCLISLSGGDKRAQSATFMPPNTATGAWHKNKTILYWWGEQWVRSVRSFLEGCWCIRLMGLVVKQGYFFNRLLCHPLFRENVKSGILKESHMCAIAPHITERGLLRHECSTFT